MGGGGGGFSEGELGEKKKKRDNNPRIRDATQGSQKTLHKSPKQASSKKKKNKG